MARYIDADLLMKELGITDPDCEKCEWVCKGFPSCSRDGDFVDACDAICEAPTADVRENVHAHWEKAYGDSRLMCSVCKSKEIVPTMMGKPIVWSFCPNCGARIDEVTE